MRSWQKVVVSLLGSVLFFAAFTLAAFLGLFSAVETRFYRPSLVSGIHAGLRDASDILDSYLDNLKETLYTDFVQNDHVKQSFSFEQSNDDIRGRENAAGNLFAAVPALTAVRIIDSDGKKIHYSTLLSDIFKKSDTLISYKLYKDVGELPYEYILSEEGTDGRLIFDPERGRIIYSFPFYDSYSAYRGTIVFYTAASDFARELIRLNSSSITDTLFFTGTEETPIFVLSFPQSGREFLRNILVKRAQEKNIGTTEKIIESEDSHDKLIFSHLSRSGIYVSRIYEENLFLLSDTLKLLLLISVFITSFLIIFLILNIKQDDMLVVRDKIRRFQFAVIHDYLKRKEEVDWNAVCADMKRRRQEINIGIKKSLGRKARRHIHEVDYLLDKNWDEIIAVLQNQNIPIEKDKAQSVSSELKMLMEELAKRPELISAVRTSSASQESVQTADFAAVSPAVNQPEVVMPAEAEELEEVELLEEAEAVEEADELTEEAEALEGVEPLEEAEAVEEADELIEEPEVLEEAEPLAGPEKKAAYFAKEKDEAKALDPDDPLYEELRIGESGLKSETEAKTGTSDAEIEDIFSGIEMGLPDFSGLDDIPKKKTKNRLETKNFEAEECIDAEKVDPLARIPFSFTLGKYAAVPKTLLPYDEPILEKDGLFVISAEAGAEIKDSTLDTEFKTLVKSVLK